MTIFVYAPGLVPLRVTRNLTRYDEYLIAHKGIDVAILAFNLKVSEGYIRCRQRKLGLRPFSGNKSRRGYHA